MRVESVTVGTGSLEALVRFDPHEPLRTDAALAARALELLPGLGRHRCENDAHRIFAAEIRDTEVAHLLEHVACELMALAGSPRTLGGETSWDFARDGRGVFRVTLRFDDDLVALGALKASAEVVEALAEGRQPPDVDETVAKLRELRDR